MYHPVHCGRILVGWLGVALFLCPGISWARDSEHPRLDVTETSLGKTLAQWQREGGIANRLLIGPRSRRLLYIVAQPAGGKRGKSALWGDGRELAVADGIGPCRFSADGKHTACLLINQGVPLVMVDGVRGPPCRGGIDGSTLTLSPDGEHVVYWAQPEGRPTHYAVVVDHRPGTQFFAGNTVDGLFAFSADSRWVAHGAKVLSDASTVFGGGEVAVLREIHGPYSKEIVCDRTYQKVVQIALTSDARRMAYVGQKAQDKFVVTVHDGYDPHGRESAEYAYVAQPTWSPDGRRLAFIARRGGAWFVALDGKHFGPYQRVWDVPFRFSPCSALAAWHIDPRAVVINGIPGRAYARVAFSGPLFTAEGGHYAYLAEQGGQGAVIVLDGREIPLPGGVSGLNFTWSNYFSDTGFRLSPDGTRVLCITKNERKRCAAMNGELGPLYDEVHAVRFSADGRHYSYSARQGQYWQGLRDTTVYGIYEDIVRRDPAISDDGSYIAFRARTRMGWQIFVNRAATTAYDDIVSQAELVFDGPDRLHTIMVRGGEYCRVEIRIE